MRQILFIIGLIVLSSYSSNAQITISNLNPEYLNQPKDGIVYKLYDTFQNTKKGVDTLYWQIVLLDTPQGWIPTGVCDNVTCYSAKNTNIHKAPMASEEAIAIYTDIKAMPTAASGCAVFRLVVNGTGIPTNTAVTYIHTDAASVAASCKTLGVSQHDFIEAKFSPNPVFNGLNVTFNQYQNLTAKFYDVFGKKVFEQTITKNNNYIDVSNFANGIYIAKLVNDKNNIVYAQKIIKQ